MTWFVDDESAIQDTVAFSRSRALGAGIDPFEYERLTRNLSSLREWLPTFAAAGRVHGDAASTAAGAGYRATAAAEWRAAAACAHVANTLPHPDLRAAVETDRYAAAAIRRYAHLCGPVVDLRPLPSGPVFDGELRLPSTQQTHPPVAIIIPGLDSARAEFTDVAAALLTRGIAVATIDGPGQGALVDRPPHAAYGEVITAVIDTLDTATDISLDRIALIGLSLGGLYAMLGAADPRVTTLATVSGAYPFPSWDQMPRFAVDTLTLRCGDSTAAERFSRDITHHDLPKSVRQPMLVVTGGDDTLPTPTQAQRTAATATAAQLLLVPGGDHLLGNTRGQWLNRTADWLTDQLT